MVHMFIQSLPVLKNTSFPLNWSLSSPIALLFLISGLFLELNTVCGVGEESYLPLVVRDGKNMLEKS